MSSLQFQGYLAFVERLCVVREISAFMQHILGTQSHIGVIDMYDVGVYIRVV